MSARKPAYHGRDHRPGGEDPIPDLGAIKMPYLRIAHADGTIVNDTAANGISLLAASTEIATNDVPGGGLTTPDPGEPFAGTYFSFDLDLDPYSIGVGAPGIYLHHAWVQVTSDPLPGSDYDLMVDAVHGTTNWFTEYDYSENDYRLIHAARPYTTEKHQLAVDAVAFKANALLDGFSVSAAQTTGSDQDCHVNMVIVRLSDLQL